MEHKALLITNSLFVGSCFDVSFGSLTKQHKQWDHSIVDIFVYRLCSGISLMLSLCLYVLLHDIQLGWKPFFIINVLPLSCILSLLVYIILQTYYYLYIKLLCCLYSCDPLDASVIMEQLFHEQKLKFVLIIL